MSERVYLDHAATTRTRPKVVEAMLPFLGDAFGNPSSVHRRGRQARAALDKARAVVASALGVAPSALVFTASGTEANNLALRGALGRATLRALLATGAEHPSVTRTLADLAGAGFAVTETGVDSSGAPDLARLADAARAGAALASFSLVNSETGAILPAEAIAETLRPLGVPVHLDAVQALGKLPAERIAGLPADLVTVSAHKIGGPKGVGALAIKARGLRLAPVLTGGGQEFGLRAGTENVAGIVGFARAVELALAEQPETYARAERLRARLLAGLRAACPEAVLHGDPAAASPFIVNLGIPGAESETLVQALDLEGVEVSSGTACSSGRVEPSRVLALMGSPHAASALRASFGHASSEADVDAFLAALSRVLGRMR